MTSSRPVRVLHLRASNFLGGPERQVLHYAQHGNRIGIHTVIGSFVSETEGKQFLDAAGKLNFATIALPADSLSGFRKLYFHLQDGEFSLLCTHGYKADILGVLAGRLTGVPVVPFLRGWTKESAKVRAYEFIDRILLRQSDRIVCLSQSQARKIETLPGLRGKLSVIVNAIQAKEAEVNKVKVRSDLRQRFGIEADELLVVSAGRLSPEKGTTYFVEAIARIAKQFPTAKFLIFGDGPEAPRLKRQSESLEVAKSLQFAGHVPDFVDLISGFDLFVNPSCSEEMPNVVLEAMAAGIPVIATAVGGVPEIAGDGESPLLIPSKNPETMAHRIAELLRDPLRRRKLGDLGRRRIAEAFSLQIQRDQLFELYAELCPELKKRLEPSAENFGATPILDREPDFPMISVVMPVRNEEKHIASVLQELVAQDYPHNRFEIIVADGNSTDRTREVCLQAASNSDVRIQVIPNPAQLSSAGRNIGIQLSRGEIIVFVDGHCRIPTRNLLLDTSKIIKETKAGCLCRPQPLGGQDLSFFQKVVASARASFIGHGRDSTIFSMTNEGFVDPTSSGATYKREVFELIGLYDTSFDACEDVELNYRVSQAGIKSFISPRLAIHYEPRDRFSALFRQMMRYGRGRFKFLRKHPSAITVTQLLPPAFLLTLIILAVTGASSEIAFKVLTTILVIYLGSIFISCAWLGLLYGWRHLMSVPLAFVAIHFGLGAGFLAEGFWSCLFSRRRTRNGARRFSNYEKLETENQRSANCP